MIIPASRTADFCHPHLRALRRHEPTDPGISEELKVMPYLVFAAKA